MSKRELLERAVQTLERLSIDQLTEVADFADFLLQKAEDHHRTSRALTALNAQSASFGFLEQEDDLYSIADLKERYQ